MISLAIDAMGGDHAPLEIIKGVKDACEKLPDTQFFLVGIESILRNECERLHVDLNRVQLVHTDEFISMAESPVEALKKKRRSSIAVAVQLVKSGKAQAVVSAGNTGATVAANYMGLGCLKGARRPGIAACFYLHKNPVVMMDVGANIHCKPEDLYAYAVMGSVFAREVLSVKFPRIGLLNIGEEDKKGIPLVKETNTLLQQSTLNYIGNVEGDNILSGEYDLIICEGFVGNTVLKVAEGISENVMQSFMDQLKQSDNADPATLATVKNELERFRWRIDYAEQGGAALLGVKGACIISHGRSHARAIRNAMVYAHQMVKKKINEKIKEQLIK